MKLGLEAGVINEGLGAFSSISILQRGINLKTLAVDTQVFMIWSQSHNCILQPGLPDGIFSIQKSQFEYILKGLEMEGVGIFIWPFVILCGHLVFLCPFGV
jgi:hypothetical protein